MIRVRIAHIGSYNFVPALAFEPVLDVGGAEPPQRLAGHNAEQQVIATGRILRAFCRPRWHIIHVLVGWPVMDDHTVDLKTQNN